MSWRDAAAHWRHDGIALWLLPTLGLGLGGGWVGFLITAFIGAVVLLLIVNLFTRGRAT